MKMNFDLSWFTTIPGMFITGGVILLIIALIILIVTGRKSKKEKKAAQTKDAALQDANVGVQTAVNAAPSPADSMAGIAQPVAIDSMAGMPQATPVEVAPVAPVSQEVVPAMTESTIPVMDNVSNAPASVEPVIYGGASPVVSDINVNQEEKHQIYGGADPLQNTQTIPTVAAAPAAPQVTEPVMVNTQTPEVLANDAVAVAPAEVAPVAPVETIPTVTPVQQ